MKHWLKPNWKGLGWHWVIVTGWVKHWGWPNLRLKPTARERPKD